MLLTQVANLVSLCTVWDSFDESGYYHLEPLGDLNYAAIDERNIGEILKKLPTIFYCGGEYHEIKDDQREDEIIIINLDDGDRLEIRDIIDEIDVEPMDTRYFIVVDEKRTQYLWVIAERCGEIYSDQSS